MAFAGLSASQFVLAFPVKKFRAAPQIETAQGFRAPLGMTIKKSIYRCPQRSLLRSTSKKERRMRSSFTR